MRRTLPLLSLLLLGACSLISPYTITFTTTKDQVVDPATSTLDFVVSVPTLAYISGVSCAGAAPVDVLPVEDSSMEVSAAHNLALTILKDQTPGALCTVTVTAYDKTTTEHSSASLEVKVAGEVPAATETPTPTTDSSTSVDTGVTVQGAMPLNPAADGGTSTDTSNTTTGTGDATTPQNW